MARFPFTYDRAKLCALRDRHDAAVARKDTIRERLEHFRKHQLREAQKALEVAEYAVTHWTIREFSAQRRDETYEEERWAAAQQRLADAKAALAVLHTERGRLDQQHSEVAGQAARMRALLDESLRFLDERFRDVRPGGNLPDWFMGV